MNDIDQLKNKITLLEAKLRSQKHFFESILSIMPGHIYWLDKDNRYLGCNMQQAYDAGLSSSSDIVGKKNIDLPWKAQAEALDKANIEVLSSGKPLKMIEKALINNTIITYMTEKIALRDEHNNINGLVGISIDITELTERKKQLEIATQKAKAADRAKAEFIANMSHDIRTPLTGMIGLASIVENESHEEDIKRYAHMLNLSGEQLLSLLNSVLDIVAADTIGQKSLRLSTFNLEELLHSIFELELPSLQLKSIHLTLEMDEDLPKFFVSDKEKIYRIVLNIVSNAIKFTPNGSITIKASKCRQNANEILTKIQIIDTGIGIAKNDVSKVFEEFYRAAPAQEGKFDGYGIGLHIVQKYLKLLRGDVFVESEVGKGTCISLSLPLTIAPMPKECAFAQPAVNDAKLSAQPNLNQSVKPLERSQAPESCVLLVEDNLMARTVVKTMLTKAHCSVIEAENGNDAYALFVNHSFDFVLTDIGLPDFSGLELTKKIRRLERNEKRAATPIIALSGHSTKDTSASYTSKYGLTDSFTKPIQKEALADIIERYGRKQTCSDTAVKTPAPHTGSPTPLLDLNLATKQLGTVKIVREMAQIMIDDVFVNTIADIDRHYQAQDWAHFKSQLHKLKSSCLYCATLPLLALVERLESLADSKDIHTIAPVYDAFLSCAAQTKQYITTWLSDG